MKLLSWIGRAINMAEVATLLVADGTLSNALFSGARRTAATGSTGQDYTTATDVTALLDTSEYDDGGPWWNVGDYFEVPAAKTRVRVSANVSGLDLINAYIQHANSADAEQEKIHLGRNGGIGTTGTAVGYSGGATLAVAATDRIRLFVQSSDVTADVTALETFMQVEAAD